MFLFSATTIAFFSNARYNLKIRKSRFPVNGNVGEQKGKGIILSTGVKERKSTGQHTGKGYAGVYNRIIKRILDLILAVIASVVVTPIILVLGVFIALEDGFPILYTPLRGGYRGKSFHIFKLRTMRKDADRFGGTTALNDPRITKTGRLLRKVKLDELPQAYNVLLGSMSFVGPRPELLRYTEAYAGEEQLILQVRPGITDFSSIEYISLDEIVGAENADEMYEKYVLQKKNQLRIRYAKEVSFRTDVLLFFKTVGCVFKKVRRVVKGKR